VAKFLEQVPTISDHIVGYGKCGKLVRGMERCDSRMTFNGGIWSCPSCGGRYADGETTGNPEAAANLVTRFAKEKDLRAIAEVAGRGYETAMAEARPLLDKADQFPNFQREDEVRALVDVLTVMKLGPDADGGVASLLQGVSGEQAAANLAPYVDTLKDHIALHKGADGQRWYKRFINQFCRSCGLPVPHPDVPATPVLHEL